MKLVQEFAGTIVDELAMFIASGVAKREALPETLRACRESSIAVIAYRRDRMFVPIRPLEV